LVAVVAVVAVEAALAARHLAVVAQLLLFPVRAHLEAVVEQLLLRLLPVREQHLAHLPLLQAVVVPALVPLLRVRAHLVLLALLRVVVVLAVVAVEAAHKPLLLSRQSFSAATAKSTP
jgi:hypothetical protein